MKQEPESVADLLQMIIGAAHAPIEDDPIGQLPEVVYVNLDTGKVTIPETVTPKEEVK